MSKLSEQLIEYISLEGKVAILTGSASGIGKEIAMLFSEVGAKISLFDINENEGKKIEQEIIRRGGIAKFVKCDVTSRKDCEKSVKATIKNFGKIDILCNNAGIIIRKDVLELTEDEWERVINVNLKSVYLMCHFVIPFMIKNGGGSIINIGSGWALKGGPKAVAYCASKAGVLNMTKAMAIDHGKHNIRINCICPGDTETPMLESECKQLGENFDKFIREASNRPISRIGKPEDIALAALFLASDMSKWITGTYILVDGGGLA